MNAAARATWAPGSGSRHGREWSPWETCIDMSSCQAGWNSTSSIRFPKRSWVRSWGGFSFASLPSSIVSARPARSPTARMVSIPKSPPSRETASTSGRSAVKTL